MNRNDFLFSQSARLYQQSEDLSSFLLSTFLGDDHGPFDETFKILAKKRLLRLDNDADYSKAADVAWDHLLGVASALDPRIVIPGLLETIEQYYYGPDQTRREVIWLGTAMKLAVAVVWPNRKKVFANIKAQAQVRRLVAAAGAWEQLNLRSDQARALNFGPAEFTPYAIRLERAEDQAMSEAWNVFASKRGLAHRTLEHSKDVIWKSGGSFMDAVASVLAGEKPSQIGLLQGTVFEAIESMPDFWIGLAARLQLLAHASLFRGLGRSDHLIGITLFESFAFEARFFGSDAAKADAVSKAMFWQHDWYAPRLARRDNLANMLVERPVIRIDDDTFVVAMLNMGDSINCFVEHSVFRCIGYGGTPVSEEAFRRYISQPFEDRAIASFTDQGWTADHVSENGLWAGQTLINMNASPIPGEVDVLTMHPSGRIAILAECKVLTTPLNRSKLLSVTKKLGPMDAEGFHRKLEAKAAWLKNTSTFRDVELLRLIVVDEGTFMGQKGPNLTIDIESLPSLIQEIDKTLEGM
jgi:hypothetical protein